MTRIPSHWKRGVIRLVLGLFLVLPAHALAQQHPLEPVDTDSPRAVLEGFLIDFDVVTRVYSPILAGAADRPSASEIKVVEAAFARNLRRLDLSAIAPTARLEEGSNTIAYLYEVLSRIELPPMGTVPDANMVRLNPTIASWTVPHTSITIARVESGPRAGEFLFTSETVARSHAYYERVRDLPYLRDMPIENVVEIRQIIPGNLVPLPVIQALPDFMRETFLGQGIWKLMATVLLLALLVGVLWMVNRAAHPGEGASPVRYYFGQLAAPVTLLVLLGPTVYLLGEQINLVGDMARGMKLVGDSVGIIVGTWAAWLACLAVAELVIASPRVLEGSLNAQLLRLTARVAGIALGLTVIFLGANRLGLPLLGVLAGVGVGGLAVALAAQDSLKNLLGSLMIFMDQPYKPGQRIIVETQDGFVEQIGLRSTRIRLMNGSLATIPNEKMARLDVENIGERTFMRRVARLRLPLDTPTAKVEKALSIVRDVLDNHEGMIPKLPPRVFLDEVQPDALTIFVMYWFTPPRRWKFYAFNEKVNLQILRRFEEEGIELALPKSVTVFANEAAGESEGDWPTGRDIVPPRADTRS